MYTREQAKEILYLAKEKHKDLTPYINDIKNKLDDKTHKPISIDKEDMPDYMTMEKSCH